MDDSNRREFVNRTLSDLHAHYKSTYFHYEERLADLMSILGGLHVWPLCVLAIKLRPRLARLSNKHRVLHSVSPLRHRQRVSGCVPSGRRRMRSQKIYSLVTRILRVASFCFLSCTRWSFYDKNCSLNTQQSAYGIQSQTAIG